MADATRSTGSCLGIMVTAKNVWAIVIVTSGFSAMLQRFYKVFQLFVDCLGGFKSSEVG